MAYLVEGTTVPTKSEEPEAAAEEEKKPASSAAAANAPAASEAAPEDPPPTQIDKGNETAYSQARLIADASSLTGYPSHEVAGALHDNTEDYLTVAEAQQIVANWLEKPTDSGEEG